MTRPLILLIVCLFLTSFSTIGQKREVKIALLSDEINSEAQRLLVQLETEIKNVVGEDATVVFPPDLMLINNNNEALATEQYQTVLESEADIILAFGIPIFRLMQKQSVFPKPVILFGNAPVEFFNLDVNRKSSGIDNLSYIITTMTYKEDLKTFYDIYEYQNIGIAVEKNLHDVLPFDNFIEGTFENKAAKFRIIPFQNEGDIIANLDSLDALYMSGGDMWEGMAIAIMVGLLFGTLITLLFIPCFYSVLYKVHYSDYQFNEELIYE